MKRQRGMTLLELMVALAIFAVIGTGLYPVLLGAMSSRREAAARIDTWATARAVLDRVEQDLRGAVDAGVDSPLVPRFFAPEPATRGFGGGERLLLDLTTALSRGVTSLDGARLPWGETAASSGSSPPPSRLADADAPPSRDRGDQARVAWRVDAEGRLLRQEARPPRPEEVDWRQVAAEVLAQEAELRFEFFEPEAVAWRTSWDSREPGPRRGLAPVLVRTTLTLADPPRDPVVLVSSILLPAVEDPWSRQRGRRPR